MKHSWDETNAKDTTRGAKQLGLMVRRLDKEIRNGDVWRVVIEEA